MKRCIKCENKDIKVKFIPLGKQISLCTLDCHEYKGHMDCLTDIHPNGISGNNVRIYEVSKEHLIFSCSECGYKHIKNILNNKESEIKDRLMLLQKYFKLSKNDFAKTLNMSKLSYGNIEAELQGLTISTAIILFEKYDVNLNWLLASEGSMLMKNSE